MGQTSIHALKKPTDKSEWQQQIDNLTIARLLEYSEIFNSHHPFNTRRNRWKLIMSSGDSNALSTKIMEHCKSTRIVVHEKVQQFITEFLTFKSEFGTPTEKLVYKGMKEFDFINRLIEKRAVFFFSGNDSSRLRNGTEPASIHWLKVGAEKEGKIKLAEYLSYDEMQISALIGVSSPTFFINDGSRDNGGTQGEPGEFEPEGIYVGLVGARFEHLDKMESEHVLIFEKSNTSDLGYGANAPPDSPLTLRLEPWARLYGQMKNGKPRLLSWDEAMEEWNGEGGEDPDAVHRRLQIYRTGHEGEQLFFNKEVYSRRLSFTVETFLLEADARGRDAKRSVYVHAVGLGLGAWQVCNDQEQWLLDVFAEVVALNPLNHITDINFSWWKHLKCGKAGNGELLETSSGHKIRILFSKRNPADKLRGEDSDKLLVCSYAWDSNAFPGNEYWCGLLSASGDPAAACCSTIPEVQNPYVNPCLCAHNLFVACAGREDSGMKQLVSEKNGNLKKSGKKNDTGWRSRSAQNVKTQKIDPETIPNTPNSKDTDTPNEK